MSSTISKRQITLFALAILAVAIITALVTALAMNITGRKVEAEQTFTKVVDLDETTVDPAIWGRNFPAQYQTFKQTAQAVPTVHGGNEIVDKEKTEKDPRTKIAPSHLTDDPRLKEMWAGYAFATDYRFPPRARLHAAGSAPHPAYSRFPTAGYLSELPRVDARGVFEAGPRGSEQGL